MEERGAKARILTQLRTDGRTLDALVFVSTPYHAYGVPAPTLAAALEGVARAVDERLRTRADFGLSVEPVVSSDG